MRTIFTLASLLLPLSALADEPSICAGLQSAKAQLGGTPACPQAKALQADFVNGFPAFQKECQDAEALIGKKKLEKEEFQALRTRLHKFTIPASLPAAMAATLPKDCAKDVEPLLQYRREVTKVIGKINQKLSE